VGAMEGLAVDGVLDGVAVVGAMEGLTVDGDFDGAAVLAADGVVVVGDKVVGVKVTGEIVCWEFDNVAMMHALLICPAYATWQQINWVV
jgi:hypothetical protein